MKGIEYLVRSEFPDGSASFFIMCRTGEDGLCGIA